MSLNQLSAVRQADEKENISMKLGSTIKRSRWNDRMTIRSILQKRNGSSTISDTSKMKRNGNVGTHEEYENDPSRFRHVRIVSKPYDYESLSTIVDAHALALIGCIPIEILT